MSDISKILWQPNQQQKQQSNLTNFMQWLKSNKGLSFDNYSELWQWSVDHIDLFWESCWQYFDISSHAPYKSILQGSVMPHYKWFDGATLNYAEHVFRNYTDEQPAIIFQSEKKELEEISWKTLKEQTAAFRKFLLDKGVGKGDRVVAYLPACPEATVAFLAVNSLGAIWSSCSPDFGTSSVIDRFAQIEPKVLLGIDGYYYGGKAFNKMEVMKSLAAALPTLEHVVLLPYLNDVVDCSLIKHSHSWESIVIDKSAELYFEPVDFSHPIWVLYSSGTTGIPKAITHSHGGILLEHLKYLHFHQDIKPGERCFWYTTTGWMMWNYIQSALLCKATIVLYDGSPAWPDLNVLWEFSESAKINHFGTSAGFVLANMKADLHPGLDFDLSELRSIGSTGSPLPPEGFKWIYKEIKKDLWLTSISGGTDVCSAFVGGNPLWPVHMGEIQCRALGCKLEAFDEEGNALTDEVGEMVITKPMPSMPVFFWNDKNFERYNESYFDMYPGVWRHGDWTSITPREGIVIYGRSDATLNRGGVRIGTSEVYRAVDKIKEVKDSLIICIEKPGGEYYMPLFVMMQEEVELTDEIRKRINQTLKSEYSPRHVPDEIIVIPDIPYTISGKKTEAPVKKIMMGKDPEKVINRGALKNPDSLDFFVKLFKNQVP